MGKPKTKKPKPKHRSVGPKQEQSPATKKERKPKTNPFASLPNEMVEHILEFLPLEDKKSARLVSSHWNQVLNRCVQLKIPLNRETLVKLRRQAYAITELEVLLNRVEIPPAFSFSKTVKGNLQTTKILSFMADSYYYPTPDRAQAISNSLDGAGVMALIKACKNMHTLKFNFRFLDVFKLTSPIRLNNIKLDYLHTLQLKLAYGGQQDASHTLLQLKTPQLRNLDVERFKVDSRIGSDADRNVYLALQRFIGRNNATLKTLKLVNFLTNITLANSTRTNLPIEVLNDLAKLKLESLDIQHRDTRFLLEEFENENWDAANRIMSQWSLKTLKLDMVSNDIMQRSYIVMANCRNTLTKLDLNIRAPEVQFDMTTLSQLKRLTHLTFTSDQLMMVDTFLPRSIKYLTWNAPLHSQWYSYYQSTLFPVLFKFTIGPPGPIPVWLATFCEVFFGISFLDNYLTRRTKLQVMTIGRNLEPSTAVETRSQFNRRNIDVAAALNLPKETYHVVYDTDIIRITLQSGI